jgi:hypothetical protein
MRVLRYVIPLLLIAALVLASLTLRDDTYAQTYNVDLSLGGEGAVGWSVSHIKPGMSGSWSVVLCNNGNVGGDVYIWIDDIRNFEGVNPESETGNTNEPGELMQYMFFDVSTVPSGKLNGNLILPATVDKFPQGVSASGYLKIGNLDPGQCVTLDWLWKFLETGFPQNDAQGDGISFTIKFTLAVGGVIRPDTLVAGPSASADFCVSQWQKQPTPSHKDNVIVPGSDITDFAVAGVDGRTIYAIGTRNDFCNYDWASYGFRGEGDLSGQNQKPRLWKSTDGGVTWKDRTDKVLGAAGLPDMTDVWSLNDAEDFTFFSAIAAAPDDSDFVVLAGWSWDDDAGEYVPVVVASDDGGDKFHYLGSLGCFVTSLDVSMEVGGKRNIAAGTWGGPGIYDDGRVYRFETGSYFAGGWVDTTTYDGWLKTGAGVNRVAAVVDVKFSPNFDADDTIAALCIGTASDSRLDFSSGDLDGDGGDDYLGYWVQAGTWGNQKLWNGAAGFGGYPILVNNGSNALVAAIDPSIGAGWELNPVVRRSGHMGLPYDFTGDMSSGRSVMLAVNALEYNLGSSPDAVAGEGGYLFWLENNRLSPEMLASEGNPYVASIAYHGDTSMMGTTLVGLAFPRDWRHTDIAAWYAGEKSLPVCQGIQVLRSETTDVCCPLWEEACKPPSGQFFAMVSISPNGKWAFAGTSGEGRLQYNGWWSDESAFSISGHEDVLGNAWNQSGLIDTDIDFIADVAVASSLRGGGECCPACSCVYIGTINRPEEGKIADCDSIWRTCDDESWLRIWHGALQGSAMDPEDPFAWGDGEVEWMVLGLAPEQHDRPTVIYMADLGSNRIWYSNSSGRACCSAGLGCWTGRDVGLEAIADIAVLDASTIYVVDFDGDMVKSTTGGRHSSAKVDTKVTGDSGESAHHMVAWGDWVLVGGDRGTVSYSRDGGATFAELDDVGTGQVHVAFDSYFSRNGYIYAAVAGESRGVFRTTIDAGDFKSMGACTDLDYHGIVVSSADGNPMTTAATGGVLYSSYSGSGDCADSGVARLLNPASGLCCDELSWDYIWTNLWKDARFVSQPNNIDICGSISPNSAGVLWAVDVQPVEGNADSYYDGWSGCYSGFYNGYAGVLWRYTDQFAKSGPTLIGVKDGTIIPADDCDCVNSAFILEWDRLCSACEYEVQIALDPDFRHVVWGTNTMVGSWFGASGVPHNSCGTGILVGCESSQTFYKPSDPCVPSLVVPRGALGSSTDYYWRVRARAAESGEVYRSQWSDAWSFTTGVGPDGAIRPTSPLDGASDIPLENVVFTWTSVSNATGYEMRLWDTAGKEVASYSGASTSYVLATKLAYDTSYLWQVTALDGSAVLSTSRVATFRTMPSPVPQPTIPQPVINLPDPAGTSARVWVVIGIAALLILLVIVLIFRTRRRGNN